MVKPSINHKHVAAASGLLFAFAFVYYMSLAATMPTLFNIDYLDNWAATNYLAEHHAMPIVVSDSPEIRFTEFGTTRSLRPPLSYLVSAFMLEVGKYFTDNTVLQQRLGAALMGAMTLVCIVLAMIMVFGRLSFGLAAAAVVGALPKFAFLASCNNDDIGAILSASILFTALIALKRFGPRQWTLLVIAASIGIVTLSKFTAWLLLPWALLYCFLMLRGQGVVWRSLLPKIGLVFLLCGGWWLLFNMFHYGMTDPTAINHATAIQAELSALEPNRQGYQSVGVGVSALLQNHDQFLTKTAKSAVGYLEWIDLDMGLLAYAWYALIFLLSMLGFLLFTCLKKTSWRSLDWIVVLMVTGQCIFYLHHNLVRDIQPQARYLLPLLLPVVYLLFRLLAVLPERSVCLHYGKRTVGAPTLAALTVAIVSVSTHVYAFGMIIVPSVNPLTYYTALQPARTLDLRTLFDANKVVDADLDFHAGTVQITRQSAKLPALQTNADFCDELSSNALIVIEISSALGGALSLRLDRDERKTYQDVYWGAFLPGDSRVILPVANRACSAAQFTLSKHTQQLTIRSISVYPLKIAYHGMPL